MFIKNQQGVGLLEVLIALLLLAVAVLGFSAMQLRAIQATDETLTRSDAMVIIRNISEDLRLLPDTAQKDIYKAKVTALSGKTVSDLKPITKKCDSTPCNDDARIESNVAQALLLANLSNIKVGAMDCPGKQKNNLGKLCLIASWDETEPNMNGADKSCANNNGTYIAGSSCIVMETY